MGSGGRARSHSRRHRLDRRSRGARDRATGTRCACLGAVRRLDGLLAHLAAQPQKARFIYTGGCWLFGATGDAVATEETPFRPLPAFAWMVPHLQRVLDTSGIDPVIIHP